MVLYGISAVFMVLYGISVVFMVLYGISVVFMVLYGISVVFMVLYGISVADADRFLRCYVVRPLFLPLPWAMLHDTRAGAAPAIVTRPECRPRGEGERERERAGSESEPGPPGYPTPRVESLRGVCARARMPRAHAKVKAW